MHTTGGSSAEQLADRWLAREGSDLSPPSPAARQLLAERLAARRRANPGVARLVLVATALLLPPLPGADPDWPQEFFRRFLLLGILTAADSLRAQALTDRAERRIAARLPHRLTRAERISATTVLGRAGTVQVLGSTGFGAALAVLLLIDRRNPSTWIWVGGYLTTTGLVAVLLRRVVHRPTVACDTGALTIDERLRSRSAQDVARLLMPMWITAPWLVLRLHAMPIAMLGTVGVMLMMILDLIATTSTPWRRTPVPAAPLPSVGPR